jgi:transcriptional regulator with XRE-family HTH domain
MPAPHTNDNKGNSNPGKRSAATVIVNGPRLQFFRQQASLTQEQLAQKSGFSDRLIRKAEASGLLRKATIAHLADVLSDLLREKVQTKDFTFSPELLSAQLFSILLAGRTEPTELLDACLHRDLALEVAGKELEIPFAGTYSGAISVGEFPQRLRESFHVVAGFLPKVQIFSSVCDVCVHVNAGLLHPPTSMEIDVWWFLKVSFEKNMIRSLELMYNTGVIADVLRRGDL